LFSKSDLVIGAIGIRASRMYKKIRNIPDIIFIKQNLGFGGATSYQELEKLGFTAILDLRNESLREVVENKSIKYEKIGIPDGLAPSKSQISQIISWMTENLNSGEKIFVHCNLGRGRATLVVSLYLLSRGETLDSALRLVRKRRFVYLSKLQLNCLKDFQ